MAIALSPNAATGLLAQIGDFLHYDAQISVTPKHGHVLDSDSRLQKMIRVVIRSMRRFVRMMLEKHETVHMIMADANHDEAGEAWMREMFAAFFEDEPRITVDRSPGSYYAYEFGQTSLFYHHGHKRKPSQVDSVFAGRFREIYGRTKYSYAHLGHRHSDEVLTTNLMKVEQHETLAAPDAHEANGGWPLGRSAKVITYSKHFGEVCRNSYDARDDYGSSSVKHERDKSLLLQIREARRHEYKDEVRKELIEIETSCPAAMATFNRKVDSDSLTELVSVWSRAIYLLGLAMGPADPKQPAGEMAVSA